MSEIEVIDREGVSHSIHARPGFKVMEILRQLDYGVAAICGGLCSCATCHVYIHKGWMPKLPPARSDERDLLAELDCYRPDESRLSCQLNFTDELSGIKVTIAPDS